MKTRRNGVKRVRRSSQSGYAFLFALFLMLAMLASSVVVIQNGLTQSKRRREEEMIWRGNQYVRAIRLYFRKTGHYPQDLEALKYWAPVVFENLKKIPILVDVNTDQQTAGLQASVVVDRDTRANGASIRNFGFITITGQQAGECWQRAMRCRRSL